MSGGLFEAFVYLLAAIVAVPLAERLGLGSVIGYLLAGAAIGPYALNFAGGRTVVRAHPAMPRRVKSVVAPEPD